MSHLQTNLGLLRVRAICTPTLTNQSERFFITTGTMNRAIVKTTLNGCRGFSRSTIALQKAGTPQVYDRGQQRYEIISGAPSEMSTSRVVRIFKESKPATQSSNHNGKMWKMDWDLLGKEHRWEDHLIGYQSSGDYMQGTQLKFDTKESAIKFAQSQGWDHYVQEPNVKHFRRKDYSANFYHSAGPLKHIRTK